MSWCETGRHVSRSVLSFREKLYLKMKNVCKSPKNAGKTTVHVAKQNLKRRASKGDLPTKCLCAEAVSEPT